MPVSIGTKDKLDEKTIHTLKDKDTTVSVGKDDKLIVKKKPIEKKVFTEPEKTVISTKEIRYLHDEQDVQGAWNKLAKTVKKGYSMDEKYVGRYAITALDWVTGNTYGTLYSLLPSDSEQRKTLDSYKDNFTYNEIWEYHNNLKRGVTNTKEVEEFENKLVTIFGLNEVHLDQIRILYSSDEFDKPKGGRKMLFDKDGFNFTGRHKEAKEFEKVAPWEGSWREIEDE